jgi:hypothetical protein
MLSNEEREELEALRRFKEEHSAKPIQRAFARLESLMESAHDPIISVRAFNVIAECLMSLKDEVMK